MQLRLLLQYVTWNWVDVVNQMSKLSYQKYKLVPKYHSAMCDLVVYVLC